MHRAILVAAILCAADAAAGEIVWRGPTAGVLVATTPFQPETPEPEEPAAGLGVSYPAFPVMAGKPFSISPIGAVGGGYEFSAVTLPAGVILSLDGRIVGVLMAAGAYSFEVMVRRGGDFERVSVSIAVV